MTNIAQINNNHKSIVGVLGTQTLGARMVGADKSTELWRYPYKYKSYIKFVYVVSLIRGTLVIGPMC